MDLQFIAILLIGFVLMAVVFAMFIGTFQKCPPNAALLVFGAFSAEPRIVTGGGTTVFPLLESSRLLSLEIMTFNINNSAPIYSADGIPLRVEVNVQIRVSSNPEMIMKAAQNILSKDTQEIIGIAHDVIRGKLCSYLNHLSASHFISSVKDLSQMLENECLSDMQKLGLEIVNIAVLSISDDAGYLEQLGRKASAEVKRKADAEIEKVISL